MVIVKICGITREEDINSAADAGADLLGLVVGVPSSPRNLDFSQVRNLAGIRKEVNKVAVTVFKNLESLRLIDNQLNVNGLQVHGCLQSLKSIAELPHKKTTIGAINMLAPNASDLAVEYSNVFDFLLVDTSKNNGSGGTGITHDWNLSKRIRDLVYPKPLILAGGLTPENVGEAIRVVQPYGVDVSTGVEESPGIKDREKIFKFVERAKGAKP